MLGFGDLMWTSIRPMVKVILMMLIGALYSKYYQIEAKQSRILSKLVIGVLYPCLLFSKIMVAMEMIKAESPGILVLASCFYVGLGILLGSVIMLTIRQKSATFRLGILAASAFGNWADLTNAIILSVGDTAPFRENDTAVGIAFTSMFNIIPTILTFSLAQSWLTRDFQDVGVNVQRDRAASTFTISAAPSPAMDRGRINWKWISDNRLQFIRRLIWSLFTAPNMALLMAIFISNVPVLKSLFIHDDRTIPIAQRTRQAPLGFLFEVVEMIGLASVPIGVMIIGGAFMRLIQLISRNHKLKKLQHSEQIGMVQTSSTIKPPASTTAPTTSQVIETAPTAVATSTESIPKSTIKIASSVTFARLLLIPTIGVCFWDLLICQTTGLINRDEKMLRFVIMFQSCVPTAQSIILLSQMADPAGLGLDMSVTGLMQYIVSIVTVTGWLIAIFWILYTT